MDLRAVPLQLAAFILAAGVLGLVAGWRISRASYRRAAARRQAQIQLQSAEVMLDKQTEIDRLLDEIGVLEAERDDLSGVNDLLEQTLRMQERETLLQRIAATELQLSAFRNADTDDRNTDDKKRTVKVDRDVEATEDDALFDALMDSCDEQADHLDADTSLQQPLAQPSVSKPRNSSK